MRGIRSVHWSWWVIAALAAGVVYQIVSPLRPLTIQDYGSRGEPYEPGDTLPAIDFYPVATWSGAFFDWRGRPLPEVAHGRCVALGFFLSTCPACEQVAAGWTASHRVQLGTRSMPFFWVGRSDDDGAPGWLERHSFENGLLVRDEGFRDFRVNYVPQVFVVSQQGVVLHRAILDQERLAELGDTPRELIAGACGASG